MKSLIATFFCLAPFASIDLCAASKPNFIVILTDDQSWVGTSLQIDPDDPESLSDYYRTPQIERLAQSGMRFTDAYSPAPYCCPTRRSLLIGQTPARHIYQKDQKAWPAKFRTQLSIPRMLEEADPNYRTAHFGKWDQRFDGVSPEEMGYGLSDGTTGNSTGGGKGSGGPAASEDPKLMRSITMRTTAFIDACARQQRPFFVQVSHYAVHLDIFYSERSLAQLDGREPGKKHTMPEFAAMTGDVDRAIGELIDHARGIDNTYIIFMSDNGGRTSLPEAPAAELPLNHPLRDGKGSLYEGGIRVPFIIAGPGIKAGTVSRVPVTGLDLLPTIADLAGYQTPLPESLDGGSLRPLLEAEGVGKVERRRPYLIFHQAVARKAQSAIREGDYKLVKTASPEKLELFDLSKDRGERNDLSKKLPDMRQQLAGKLDAFLAQVGAETRKTTTKEKLKKFHELAGIRLFDGKSLADWTTAGSAKWRVENGVMVGGQDGDPKRSGLIMTKQQFKDFELELEFKIDEHGKYNSGVYLRHDPQARGRQGYQINIGRGAAEEYTGLFLQEWLDKGDEHDKIRKPLAWNQLRIRAVGAHIETWLNGQKIVDYTDPHPKPELVRPGVIALQTYGAEGHAGWVHFRNIRIIEILSSKLD